MMSTLFQLRDSDVTWREIDGELVILDLASSTYLTTNRTGTVLMELLVEQRTIDELVDRLVASFDVSHDVAATDTHGFLQALADHGLLQQPHPTTTQDEPVPAGIR